MSHNVKLDNTFSGPMDLLLYLVRRDEIDIHDIPVAHLTREYLAEIEKMDLVDVDAGGEFVAMASMLTEIKSRMLLPAVESGEGEEDEEENFDPRQGLVQALLEYKRFKEVASELEEMAQQHLNRFGRMAPPPEFAARLEIEAQELGALDLFAAFQRLASKLLSGNAPREIINEEISTEVRIAQIESVLQQRERVDFTSLLSDHPTRDEMVGFFIALLELIRLKKVRAQQAIDFSEIYFFRYSVQEVEAEQQRAEQEQAAREAAEREDAPLPALPEPASAPAKKQVSPLKLAALFNPRLPATARQDGCGQKPLSFLALAMRPKQERSVGGSFRSPWGFPFVRAELPWICAYRLPATCRPAADRTPHAPAEAASPVVPAQRQPEQRPARKDQRTGVPAVEAVAVVVGGSTGLHLAALFPGQPKLRIQRGTTSVKQVGCFLGLQRIPATVGASVRGTARFPDGFPFTRGRGAAAQCRGVLRAGRVVPAAGLAGTMEAVVAGAKRVILPEVSAPSGSHTPRPSLGAGKMQSIPQTPHNHRAALSSQPVAFLPVAGRGRTTPESEQRKRELFPAAAHTPATASRRVRKSTALPVFLSNPLRRETR